MAKLMIPQTDVVCWTISLSCAMSVVDLLTPKTSGLIYTWALNNYSVTDLCYTAKLDNNEWTKQLYIKH